MPWQLMCVDYINLKKNLKRYCNYNQKITVFQQFLISIPGNGTTKPSIQHYSNPCNKKLLL